VSLCHFSPARVLQAVTVGATHYDDERTYFSSSDGGAPLCKGGLDVFAPGWQVVSDKMGGCAPQNCPWMSGTSMAAPHVAGAAAVIWGLHPEWDQFQVIDELKATASQVVGDSRSESKGLVYVGPAN
jgi:subtilisin family serine protease